MSSVARNDNEAGMGWVFNSSPPPHFRFGAEFFPLPVAGSHPTTPKFIYI